MSEKKSWKGFKLSKNLKDSIKQALYILIPAIVAELVTKDVLTASAAGLIGKVVFSALEYYFKEQ